MVPKNAGTLAVRFSVDGAARAAPTEPVEERPAAHPEFPTIAGRRTLGTSAASGQTEYEGAIHRARAQGGRHGNRDPASTTGSECERV